jgi:quinol-cytochrome oxidoreductase complex cytochrome b subunit
MENKVETTPSVFEGNQGENPQKSKLWSLFVGITINVVIQLMPDDFKKHIQSICSVHYSIIWFIIFAFLIGIYLWFSSKKESN